MTRAEARAVAGDYLRQHPELGSGVNQVLDWEEIRSRKPWVYGVTEELMRRSWIAYVDGYRSGRLTSSEVIIVSKVNGQVIYAGSANDEG